MNKTFSIYCLIVLLTVGCQPWVTGPSISAPETQLSNDATVESQIAPTTDVKPTSTAKSTALPVARLINQCVKETRVPPASNSIIALRSLKDVVSGQYPDIILIDMSKDPPRQTIQKINITPDFSVSPNWERIAYLASTITDREVTQVDLDIANGDFQIQNSIPYENQWYDILGWTADQRVIISTKTEETLPSSVSQVLVNPTNGSQQAVDFSIPDFLGGSQFTAPHWDGWYGIVIDPTRRWAVYLIQSDISTEMYTYGLWDIANNKPMMSFDTIFSSPVYFTKAAPIPIWSHDGKQFAFVSGRFDQAPGEFELFTVNVNGDITQLTALSGLGYVWPTFHSWNWSPDNKHIAFLASPPQLVGTNYANVAIVNIETMDVIDLCLSVAMDEPALIWSPDGKQFLVIDKHEGNQQQVLLIDIEKKIVLPIAESAEPIGWMTKP